jgi:cysteine desulfurase
VLRAIGLNRDDTVASLRFGLSRFTTSEEIDYTIDRLVEVIQQQRAGREKQKTVESEVQ